MLSFNFGFSYIGLIFLLMLIIPNMIWVKRQPTGYETYAANENGVLRMFERAGEVLVSCVLLVFADFNVQALSVWSVWLLLSFLLMILYEVYWVRYFRSSGTMSDFYRSLLGVPVPGAVYPVAAFLLLGIYGRNIWLIAATIILGTGHIGIHWQHYKEVKLKKA